ncbi:hypothetical protein I5192_22345 (plasmid) [Ruegeria sp. SCSIO 43209]|nr:hypothetical protein I5192_22345 [Ruegeria sp. SCSIO 43209]
MGRFEEFDVEFFGLSSKEVTIMASQHRQFLEVAWEVPENAGHPPENSPDPSGCSLGVGKVRQFAHCFSGNIKTQGSD